MNASEKVFGVLFLPFFKSKSFLMQLQIADGFFQFIL